MGCRWKAGRAVLPAAMAVVAVLATWSPAATTGWQIEPIGPAAAMPVAPAMVFDGQDRANVVYSTDAVNLQYSYASGAGATPTWTASAGQSAFGSGPWGQQAFLAAAGNTVYVGCSRVNTYGVGSFTNYAAAFNGTGWTPLATFLPNNAGIFGVAADAGGQVHWLLNAAMTNADTARGLDTPGYYLLDGTSATTMAVKVAPGINAFPNRYSLPEASPLHLGGQMLFDASGNLRTIQYYENGSDGVLLYATGPAGGPFAFMDMFDDGWEVKMGPASIAADPSGGVHVVYAQQWPYYGVKYLHWDGSSWSSEWVEKGGNILGYIGTFPKVVVDKAGLAHVVYADLAGGLLKHAVRGNAGWQIETIDTIGTQVVSGQMSGSLAAAMDSVGGIGVAYWSGWDFQLKYAYLTTKVPADINGDGQTDVIDLLYLIDSFGKCNGEPGYDARCDLDGSGCVDVLDLLILIEYFGL